MAIPKMTENIRIIQALSNLPNSEDGLSAEELKAKFDAAGLAIQKYLNDTLIPALTASQIPFTKTNEINAETIQLAIEDVQRQVRDAATGTIVNGSITKEKIAASLLDRIYGGRAWISADTPGQIHNPDSDFPIGQVWLRPEFTVVNDAGDTWIASGCTAVRSGHDVVITGLSQVASVIASQSLSGIGNDGDRIMILFQIEDRDSEITQMTASINGAAAQQISGSVSMDAVLSSGGTMTLEIGVTWPSTSLASGSVTLGSFTVVNLDKIMRQLTKAGEIADWGAYLWEKAPFVSFTSKEALFVQAKSGVWNQIAFDVLPIDRGGTGVSTFPQSQYMKTGPDGTIGFLTKDDVISDLGQLRMMTGTYTGTGETGSITLPIAPKIILIFPASGPVSDSASISSSVFDNPVVISDGCEHRQVLSVRLDNTVKTGTPSVSLDVDTLKFKSSGQVGALLCNRSGEEYKWAAIY